MPHAINASLGTPDESAVARLADAELERVAAGKGASAPAGQIYLKFNFKLVAVKTVSW